MEDALWNSMRFKILGVDNKPVSSSLELHMEFVNKGGQRIRQAQVGWFWISTVFLLIDHDFSFSGRSIHFETMVFNHNKRVKNYAELDMNRYHTYEESIKGHAAMVRKYRKIWNKRLKKLYAHM